MGWNGLEMDFQAMVSPARAFFLLPLFSLGRKNKEEIKF